MCSLLLCWQESKGLAPEANPGQGAGRQNIPWTSALGGGLPACGVWRSFWGVSGDGWVSPTECDVSACLDSIEESKTLCCSAAVWVHHHLRGGVPSCPALRPPEQLGGNPSGCPQVCVWVSETSGRTRPEHRSLVQHPRGSVTPVGHRQRELCRLVMIMSSQYTIVTYLTQHFVLSSGFPDRLHLRFFTSSALPVQVWQRSPRIRQLHAGSCPPQLQQVPTVQVRRLLCLMCFNIYS